MGKAPKACPMCGERYEWKRVDVSSKGFSAGKAAVGGLLFGPLGLLGGALGKRHEFWACGKCGFCHEWS